MSTSKSIISKIVSRQQRGPLSADSRVFRGGLSYQLFLIISGISLISVLVATILIFTFQINQIYENARSSTNALSATIEANLRHAMLDTDWEMINEVIHAVADENNIWRVIILDPQGRIVASSRPEEVGTQIALPNTNCPTCFSDASPSTNQTILSTSPKGSEILLNVNLIQNRSECVGCHSAEQDVLGMLMIEAPLTGVHDQLTLFFWVTILVAACMLVLLVILIMPVLNRKFIRPIEALSHAVNQISAGNLNKPVHLPGGDEFARLALSFDTMRRQLKAAQYKMERRNRELSVLNEVAAAVNQSLNLQQVLDTALQSVAAHLDIENAFIMLADEATGRFVLHASWGASEALCLRLEKRRQDPDMDISTQIAYSGKTLYYPNMAADPRFDNLWDHLSRRSYINVPLKTTGKVVGTLAIVGQVDRPIDESEAAVIEALGNEIGIAIANALLLEQANRDEREANTLYDLGAKVSASLAINEVLDAVAAAAQELLAADTGLVGLLDEDRQEIVMLAASGLRSEALKGTSLPVGVQAPGRQILEGSAIIGEAYDPSQPIYHTETITADVPGNVDAVTPNASQKVSFLTVPLQLGEEVLGLIEVVARQERQFKPREAQLLTRLAQNVVVAIQNARLYNQLRHLVTLEERDRLAREMHDRIAQSLGYLNIKASITADLLNSGKVGETQESLDELKKVACMVYTDVRESIFNLRTAASTQSDLVLTLYEYLDEYHKHFGLDAQFAGGELLNEFDPETSSQVLRIIQEAMTNVRKHAGARKVSICCWRETGAVCISIEDDGRGLLPAEIEGKNRNHYGLQIMRERAESVGGCLALDSQPGKGTRVLLCIPSPPKEGMPGKAYNHRSENSGAEPLDCNHIETQVRFSEKLC